MSAIIYIICPIMGTTKMKNTYYYRYFFIHPTYNLYIKYYSIMNAIFFFPIMEQKNKSKAKFICFTFLLSNFSKTLRYLWYGSPQLILFYNHSKSKCPKGAHLLSSILQSYSYLPILAHNSFLLLTGLNLSIIA